MRGVHAGLPRTHACGPLQRHAQLVEPVLRTTRPSRHGVALDYPIAATGLAR